MLNEQEREYNGVKLVAKPQFGCGGCFFDLGGHCLAYKSDIDQMCTIFERKDKTPIIWIQKQEPKPWYPPVPEGFSDWVECYGKDPGLGDKTVAWLTAYGRRHESYRHVEIKACCINWAETVAYCIKLVQPKSPHPPIMEYDPATGESKPYPSEASQYRAFHGDVAWLYNPYTGDKRDPRDIGLDVFGHGVTA